MSEQRYRVVIQFDPEKEQYLARAPELPGCVAEGESYEAALSAITEEMDAQVENIKESGGRVPVPVDEQEVSGEITLRISKTLHRELHWLALLEELEDDELASEVFQDGLKHRLRSKPRQRRQPGPPRKEASEGNEDRQPTEDDQRGRGRQGRGRPNRGRGRGRGGGARYHEIMEDKASFLEYVRGLDSGGGHGNRGGGGRGRGRR
jgi:predicted RNase H-like HicB family nuclease